MGWITLLALSLGSSQVYKEHQHFLLNFAPPVEAALFALALLYHTIQKISYRVSNSFNQVEMNMAAAPLLFTHSHTQARYPSLSLSGSEWRRGVFFHQLPPFINFSVSYSVEIN